MKRNETATEFMIIRANTTNPHLYCCDFAIIHLTKEWKETLQQRIAMAEQFKELPGFSGTVFRDSPMGFYKCDKNVSLDNILNREEDWAYVILEENEWHEFSECDNHLCGFSFHIDALGLAFYKATAGYTDEEYYTNDFNAIQFTGV